LVVGRPASNSSPFQATLSAHQASIPASSDANAFDPVVSPSFATRAAGASKFIHCIVYR
jgi:hypothetical protein